MSKKSRRQRRLNLPPEAYNNPVAVAPAARIGADSAITPAQRGIAQINWKDEYGDVLGDLKRTGILAAIMIAAMIVLSFIIR